MLRRRAPQVGAAGMPQEHLVPLHRPGAPPSGLHGTTGRPAGTLAIQVLWWPIAGGGEIEFRGPARYRRSLSALPGVDGLWLRDAPLLSPTARKLLWSHILFMLTNLRPCGDIRWHGARQMLPRPWNAGRGDSSFQGGGRAAVHKPRLPSCTQSLQLELQGLCAALPALANTPCHRAGGLIGSTTGEWRKYACYKVSLFGFERFFPHGEAQHWNQDYDAAVQIFKEFRADCDWTCWCSRTSDSGIGGGGTGLPVTSLNAVGCRRGCHVGAIAMQVCLPCGRTCHAGAPAMRAHMPCGRTCHAGAAAMRAHMLCRCACHACDSVCMAHVPAPHAREKIGKIGMSCLLCFPPLALPPPHHTHTRTPCPCAFAPCVTVDVAAG
eukprot:352775-Chlamydomonas_euryale.AAC.12